MLLESLWLSSFTPLHLPTLSEDITCDVCIVGGGLSGIYSAYLLSKAGFQVALIEAQENLFTGATGHSTGKLTAQHGTIYQKLAAEHAALYYQANHSAIEQALTHNPPDIQRVTSYLYTNTADGRHTLEQEATIYKQLGIPLIASKEVAFPLSLHFALGMKNEVQMNPATFAAHFAQLARQHGASLYTNTRAIQIQASDKRIVTNKEHVVHYKKLIICTHYPIESIKGLYSLKLQVSRAYLTATKTSELLQEQYISIDQPSRTIRTALVNDKPYLLYGGSAHQAGTVSDTQIFYDTLAEEVQKQYELPAPQFYWSTQDNQTPDNIPYIGPLTTKEDDIYIATGYKKWGLSTSLVAGEIFHAALTGEQHPASALYSPDRSNFGRKLYFMLTTGSFVSEQLVAGYAMRLNAPRCTHLGCRTRWNEADDTWDCPCHGSRYNKKGEVIEGPAVYPLDLKKTDEY
ncbi:MAG: FAD-dependent oxidoreductase [Solibacillus sp.]